MKFLRFPTPTCPTKGRFLTLVLLLLGVSGWGQVPRISKAAIHVTVRQMADTLARHYVFVEKRQPYRKEMLARLKSGRYDTLSSWPSFRQYLTKEMREISRDKHLYLLYNPAPEPQPQPGTDRRSPEEIDRASEAQAAKNNFGFERVEIMPGNVGYLKLSEINLFYQGSIAALQAAAAFLQHTDALVIDLRDNGGGGDDIGPVFVSWFLKKETPLLGFKTPTTKIISYGRTMNILPVERRLDTPLYILINRHTGSAAEAYSYMLQNHKRAIIVGEPSAGAANASEEYPITPFLRMSVSVAAPVSFVTHTNWEMVGVQPDRPCDPAKALPEAHLMALRRLADANAELRPLLQSLETKNN